VSYRLFTLTGETLTPLASADAPLSIAATVRRLEGLDLADQYATQKERLESELNARGEDIFVANVKVMRSPAGETFTYAVWAQDVDTLLPEADLVAFVAGVNPKPLVFPFGRVRDVLGELMVSGVEYGFPPRHRVRRYPTSSEIEALGEPSGP
jgi:O6-methylguanine-DNA--protein-cysteine methyltransferase